MAKSILIVDDSATSLAFLEGSLSKLGFDVTPASNGQEALSYVETNQFNLIITDLEMPTMNGIEFVKQAKGKPNCKFVPMVMLSSADNDAKIAEAKSAGVSTFLQKPLKEEKLAAMMRIILGSS